MFPPPNHKYGYTESFLKSVIEDFPAFLDKMRGKTYLIAENGENVYYASDVESHCVLPANIQLLAENLGKYYGEVELECWRDQHNGQNPTAPWQNGQWCGKNHYDRETHPELAALFEAAVDRAAAAVWNGVL